MSGIIGSAGSKSGIIGQTELDYEEGVWTPIFLNPSSAPTQPDGLTGTYVKIGDWVRLEAHAWANGAEVDNAVISNLPFSAKYMNTYTFQRVRTTETESPNDSYHWGLIDAGGDTLGLFNEDTTMWSNYTAASATWRYPTTGAVIFAWNFDFQIA